MINIFGGTSSPVTVESITSKAGQAMGIFQNAIELLEESTTEAANLARNNQEQIDTLTAQNNELETLTDNNDKVAQKIKDLIS